MFFQIHQLEFLLYHQKLFIISWSYSPFCICFNQLWFKDSHTTAHKTNNLGFGVRHDFIIENPDPRSTFSFRVPLKHIFGFCDDYDEVVYGFKHQLTLVRKGDNDAIFRAAAAELSWYVAYVLPALEQKLALYKTNE